MLRSAVFSAALVATTNAYWLMGVNNLFETPQRLDPLLFSGQVAGHGHKILGGSNFGPSVDSDTLRASECTTTPIQEDKSAYWVPHLYFQWSNGSFSDVDGGAVIYYLFPDDGNKTATFPDDLRMITGSANLRTYDESNAAQRAVTFLCLDYRPGSKSSRHEKIPDIECPDGVRSEINFQSCWDGKNFDSDDHKSHVAYRSGGPDSGDCLDPNFPVSIPRIFVEIYWGTQNFNEFRSQAKNPSQPFVLANGDPFGYSYHGDFINGWDTPTLRNAIDHCNCNIYGDPQCCADQGVFTYEKEKSCKKTNMVNEKTTGTLDALPGRNPVTTSTSFAPAPAGAEADAPGFVTPVFVYTDGVYPDADYTDTPAPAASSGNTSTGGDDASDDADEDDSNDEDEDEDATDDDADTNTTASSAAAAATTTSSAAPAATTTSSAAPAATASSAGGVLVSTSGANAPSTCKRGNNNTRRRRHAHRRRLEYDATF